MTATVPRPLSALEFLPADKARIAKRLAMAGEALDPARFARLGRALSKTEIAALAGALDGAFATRVVRRVASSDGSVRLVVALADGETVETVAMPVGAACLSTQVGCAVRCRFCASGQDGLRRNLAALEIVEQLVHARREMRVDRVVFMGIGEPTHNLEAVLAAVACIKHDALIGPKRQTVSTVGSTKALARLEAAPVQPCLALSLHSADPEVRRWLLPHAPEEPLPELIAAADEYGRRAGSPVQIQWTLLAGINDRDEDVAQLVELLRGLRGYVNFIVWNPVAGADFASPPRTRIDAIVAAVKRAGILATARFSAGADVEAACGQLRRRR